MIIQTIQDLTRTYIKIPTSVFGEVLPPIDLLQDNLQLFAALLFSLSLQGFLFSGFLMVLVNFPNNTGVVVSGLLFPLLYMFQHFSTEYLYSGVYYWVHRAILVSFSIVSCRSESSNY